MRSDRFSEKPRRALTVVALLPAACLLLVAGCSDPPPEGSAEDWLAEARVLEEQGVYYQEQREGAPLGALEVYRLALDSGRLDDQRAADVRRRVAWLGALKLVLAEDTLGKADYPAAIDALTAFREQYPKSPNSTMALFFRGLAREYDLDHQDLDGAVADYERFIEEDPDHSLVPEVMIRIGHCHEFDLDTLADPTSEPALAALRRSVAAYERVIERFGPTNEAVRHEPQLARLAVERALRNIARIEDFYLSQVGGDEGRRQALERAADCYRRLVEPIGAGGQNVFFDQARFKDFQFAQYRLGCLLAEDLGRVEEGLGYLHDMADRWRESPWYGRVRDRIDRINDAVGRPAAGQTPKDDRPGE